MLGADWAAYARERNVDTFRHERVRARSRDVSPFNEFRDPRLQFVDANPGLTLGILRRDLQPQIIDLGKDAVLARHPPIAKCLQTPLSLRTPVAFVLARTNALARSLLQRRRRIVRQFGNGVGHVSSLAPW